MRKLIDYRPYEKSDEGFIFNSWIKSYRKNSNFASEIDGQVYWILQHKRIEELLKRSNIIIVCSTDHKNQILGYMVYEERDEGMTIHYIYIKSTYRRFGIAKDLLERLEKVPEWATHMTYQGKGLAAKHSIAYNPFML